MIGFRPFALLVGCALILGGAMLAWMVQSSNGVAIRDVYFARIDGHQLAGRLYIPPGATTQHLAPAVLTVHAYLGSRASQSGLAIELARRGYVVLALDQPGHGRSDPPALADGFGGPDGLRYLRALPMVDPDRIGLHGHGLGGTAVLTAAEAQPDQYQAMVLDGAAPGTDGMRPGTLSFPRNLALIYGRYDAYSRQLWGIESPRDIGRSDRLAKLFGVTNEVAPGRVYGDRAAGTARVLYSPMMADLTAPISRDAIAYAVAWFDRTLRPGAPSNGADQIWMWRAVGGLVALIGLVVLLLGSVNLLLPILSLIDTPDSAVIARDGRWWLDVALTAWIPVMTFFPFLGFGATWLPAGLVFRQAVTNQILTWLLLNAAIGLASARMPGAPVAATITRLAASFGCAIASVALCVALGSAVFWAFQIDFGAWVFALRPMTTDRFLIFLIYLPGFTLAFGAMLHRLNTRLSVYNDRAILHYASNIAALAGGLFIFIAVQYGTLVATGQLLSWAQPTNIALAVQLLPIMAIAALVSTFIWRRTGNALLGSLITGLIVTWYFAAGQAVHVSW